MLKGVVGTKAQSDRDTISLLVIRVQENLPVQNYLQNACTRWE